MGCLIDPHGIPHNIVSDHRTPYSKVNVGMDLRTWESLVEPHAIPSRSCFPDRELEWSLKLRRHGGWRWGGLQRLVEEGKMSIPCSLENVYSGLERVYSGGGCSMPHELSSSKFHPEWVLPTQVPEELLPEQMWSGSEPHQGVDGERHGDVLPRCPFKKELLAPAINSFRVCLSRKMLPIPKISP